MINAEGASLEKSPLSMINIDGLDKAEVLKELYDHAVGFEGNHS